MIIEFEGLDGCGKSTQIELLKKYFDENNIKYEHIHFPRYDNPYTGYLIKQLLQGNYGNLENLDPKLTSFIFASDRLYNKEDIIRAINNNKIVLLDRYFFSNIIVQTAKYNVDFKELYDWLYNLEFNINKIPYPDIVLYLDVPFEFVENNIKDRLTENNRSYLDGKKDIYENDLQFQKRIYNNCKKLVDMDIMTEIVCHENNNMLDRETIHRKILNLLSDSFNI